MARENSLPRNRVCLRTRTALWTTGLQIPFASRCRPGLLPLLAVESPARDLASFQGRQHDRLPFPLEEINLPSSILCGTLCHSKNGHKLYLPPILVSYLLRVSNATTLQSLWNDRDSSRRYDLCGIRRDTGFDLS